MLARNQDIDFSREIDSAKIGPLNILRMERAEAIDLIRTSVLSRQRMDIAICNAHTILSALDDPAYAETLQSLTLFNDGIGAELASKVLHGKGFPDNLNGTDLIPAILRNIGVPLRIFLLGAGEEQVRAAGVHIAETYPHHTVVGVRNGYFDPSDVDQICEMVKSASPDLLLVGMGNPRQEHFIAQHGDRMGATVAIGVGALFDFMSGAVIRAPKPIQNIGLEWLFRLLQEPRRLSKRYLIGIPRFFFKVRGLKRSGKASASSK
ncbi:WecB/TagA/CpsF family glycosyltransferase [uncultured Roseibium sp.]|uniref:WecB/TagA/CpsF family glycosyltransferase n=1 Tax=uncultured Roseibium sp. TaxID=1936171 RepID=UPI003217D410